jgi:hypothetical protein
MGLISNGIDKVRVFEIPVGVWADGEIVVEARVCLVSWWSAWTNKLHQVYVNGKFAGVTVDSEQRQMVVQTPNCNERAARIEVFAVEPSEGNIDFSDYLKGSDGDTGRAVLRLLRSQRIPAGARYEVYYDEGSGEVDYENLISSGAIWSCWQDKAGFGLAGFGEGDFGYEWAAGIGFGKGGFGLGEFGADAEVIEWVSPALEAGVYRFGVKVVDELGNGSGASETGEVTVIPAAGPAGRVSVPSFDKETNVLMIGMSGGQ